MNDLKYAGDKGFAPIYLYRAGEHSIEDRLAKPKKLDNTIQVKEVKVEHYHFYDYGR